MKTVTGFILIIILLISVSCSDSTESPNKLIGKSIPTLYIQVKQDKKLHDEKINSKDSTLLLLYFSPYCDLCKIKIQSLFTNYSNISGYKIFLVTNYSLEESNRHINTLGNNNYPNIILGRDSNEKIAKYLQIDQVPFLAICKENKLVKISKGDFDINEFADIKYY